MRAKLALLRMMAKATPAGALPVVELMLALIEELIMEIENLKRGA